MTTAIRLAEESDCEAMRSIYNHYVVSCTCTFQTVPETVDERLKWFRSHGSRHPVTVYCIDDNVVGWSSLNPYHARGAYRHTTELSIYIDHRFHRRGIGRSLMSDLIDRARRLGYYVMIGGICNEQVSSLRLHETMGFVKVAQFNEVGFKFGRWLDVAYYQLTFPENKLAIEASKESAVSKPGTPIPGDRGDGSID